MVLCLKGFVLGSSRWGMGTRVGRGIPVVASGRGIQGLATAACVPPLIFLALLEHTSLKGTLPVCCPQLQGVFCLLVFPQPCLPLLPIFSCHHLLNQF